MVIRLIASIRAEVAILISAVLFSASAAAFQLVPTVSVLELPGDAGGVTVVVENPRTVPLAVEMEMVERTVHVDGTEDYSAADDLFLVFPPQAVIQPGQAQAVRVQWVGDIPDASRSFTLFANEIPVDLSDRDKPMLQTIFRMGASVHVTPQRAEPEVILSEVATSERGISLTLENIGDRFIYMNEVLVEFDDKTYTGNELANIVGRTLLPPSQKRTILIPEESNIPRVTMRQE